MQSTIGYSYTHSKDIASQEASDVLKRANRFKDRVEQEVARIREEEVNLWLNDNDSYRLLTLKVWVEKYRVPLRFILETLLPFWEGFVRRRSKKMKTRGLNVKVSTLVGKKSESILVEAIKIAFPREENRTLYISQERERILMKLEEMKRDKFEGKLKDMLEYKTPKHWLRAYRKRMEKEQRLREELADEMTKRPYRGNPFREETV